jgi:hypothetical protein
LCYRVVLAVGRGDREKIDALCSYARLVPGACGDIIGDRL